MDDIKVDSKSRMIEFPIDIVTSSLSSCVSARKSEMESLSPAGKDTAVAIAVSKGKNSQAAVKWAVDNLLSEGQSVTLLHIRPKIQAFENSVHDRHELWAVGGQGLSRGMDEGYKEILDIQTRENLLPLQSYCKKKKIQNDLVILDDGDMVKAIADYVLAHHVDVLVVGAGSQNGLFKKLKGPDVATRVSKKAPYFCTVYIVAKGRLRSVRSSSTSQALSDDNVNILGDQSIYHEPRIGGQLTTNGSSVCSRTALLRPGLEMEFEFRSPLQNYGHSQFGIGGISEFESDISFVSSDRQFCDGSSSNFSDDSSNQHLGLFTPSCASNNSSN